MVVLIPMAGRGERFVKAGFNMPKPLVDVSGKPMISRVLDNLSFDARYVFIIRQEHVEQLVPVLISNRTDAKVIVINEVTEGAACTCLLAKEFINNDDDLVIANCDQIMDWDKGAFTQALNEDVDGYIFTFDSDSPKNSYLKLNRLGHVMRAVEKQVISNVATNGVYHWSKGRHMVESCEKMIAAGRKSMGEYYLCPSYNELVEEGYIIKTFPVVNYPIGTPEDLEQYLCKLDASKK